MTSVITETNPSSSSCIENLQIRSSGLPRIRKPSFTLGQEPGQTQLGLDWLVAEALHGEVSVELRHAKSEREAARSLPTFGLLHERKSFKSLDITSRRMSGGDTMEVDGEKEEAVTEENMSWESIQEYGKYLGETAELFRTDRTRTPPPLVAGATTQPGQQTTDAAKPESSTASFVSPIEQLQWRNSRFANDFADLAPLTSRENRLHAQQTMNLIEWILDPQNDTHFRGWSGLDQIPNPPASPEEEHQKREELEVLALERILEVPEENTKASTHGKGELGWHSVGMGEGRPSSLAKYLAQEAPPPKRRRLDAGILATTERSRSNSAQTAVSDDDTRSIVSQDNHWRRTIFG